MIEAELPSLDPSRFSTILDRGRRDHFDSAIRRATGALKGRTLVHVNSTMTGGGVAELLSSVLGYLLGAGIRSRWLVVEGSDEFFVLTKRIHHMLHGKEGDGGDLGSAEASLYRSVLEAQIQELADQVHPGDVVVLHDPQVVGLAPDLRDLGAVVIWNCHIGADVPNEHSQKAWEFLLPAAIQAQAQVFSRSQYVWEGLNASNVAIIPPCIDAFAPKNQAMDTAQIQAILATAGLTEQPATRPATFVRIDGSQGVVSRTAALQECRPLPPNVPVVTQVSRWDPLKDHVGVARSFADAVPLDLGAHLVLAGPSPQAVADDPEGVTTLDDILTCTESLPESVRPRVHLACLPMDDLEENAAIVNALQRRSDVIVQKSLAEGFGLTVAEAMWKARPTVASAVGGIQDQISDGVNGLLVQDPEDDQAFGVAITSLLRDREQAASLGEAGRASVSSNLLAPSYLTQYLGLIDSLLAL